MADTGLQGIGGGIAVTGGGCGASGGDDDAVGDRFGVGVGAGVAHSCPCESLHALPLRHAGGSAPNQNAHSRRSGTTAVAAMAIN